MYNEEARLEECLADARPHVDEIVVVDQMSTDATPDIAQRLADVYIRDVHHGHAEPSRELAASRSSGEWILVLDADETMSDLLKTEIRDLIEGEADGYWIRKTNTVDGIETSTVLHLRLVRKSRAAFDPNPHGGATGRLGQRRDLRPDRHPAPEVGSRAALRRRPLRADRGRGTRSVVGEAKLAVPQPDASSRIERTGAARISKRSCRPTLDVSLCWASYRSIFLTATSPVSAASRGSPRRPVTRSSMPPWLHCSTKTGPAFFDRSPRASRPGGVVVGTVRAARNLRHVEEVVAGLVSGDTTSPPGPVGGSTRRELFGELEAAGLDVRSMGLVRDGWLDPALLRPDGSGAIVESSDFLLRSVPADVAEELTAAEIVFAAVPKADEQPPLCSVVVTPLADGDAAPLRRCVARHGAARRRTSWWWYTRNWAQLRLSR